MLSPIAGRRPFQFRLRTALLALSVCCVACLPLGHFVRSLQRPKQQLIPVSGVVTLNGQPLADAYVGFLSNDPAGRTAAGTTDATGRFSLTPYVDPMRIIAGAEPGDYTVVIHEVTRLPGSVIGTAPYPPIGSIGAVDPSETEKARAATRIRGRYSDPSTSGLRASVTVDGSSRFDFALTAE